MKTISVTCAIIQEGEKFLVVQRSAAMSQPLKWEFPGGKIEPGETAKECLIREIKEELNIDIKLGEKLPSNTHQYPEIKIELISFLAKQIGGKLILAEHVQYKYLKRSELLDIDWAPADIPVVENLVKRF